MQARFEVSRAPVKAVLVAVVLTAALLICLTAVGYAIQAGGSGLPSARGSSQAQETVQTPVQAIDNRGLGDAQGEQGPFVVEQLPGGLSATSECNRFGGPRC